MCDFTGPGLERDGRQLMYLRASEGEVHFPIFTLSLSPETISFVLTFLLRTNVGMEFR